MPRQRIAPMLRRVLVISFAFLVYLWHAGPARAWGRLGHRVIAKFAERHLADKARAEIKALLEPGESLADCSTWADEVRGKMRETAPWHYVDVPLEEPRYDDKWASEKGGYLVPQDPRAEGGPQGPLEDRRGAAPSPSGSSCT